MAPEIITSRGHNKTVDWWSTGVLLFEMLAGVPPFRAASRNALQAQITGARVKYPKFISSEALLLLKGLLTRDPERRLGAGDGGSDAVKRHPFFKARRARAPFAGRPRPLARRHAGAAVQRPPLSVCSLSPRLRVPPVLPPAHPSLLSPSPSLLFLDPLEIK